MILILACIIASFFTFFSLISNVNLTKIKGLTLGLSLVIAIFVFLVYGLKKDEKACILYSLYALLFIIYFIYDT